MHIDQTTRRRAGLLGALMLLLFIGSMPAWAQTPEDAPPCGELGIIATRPIIDPDRFCPEYLLESLPYSATAALTAIAYAPDCDSLAAPRDWCEALFFVRPADGLVQWLGAYNPETHTHAVHTFAEDLDTPTGLVWHGDALYVAADRVIYRLADVDGDNRADALDVLVDDLPGDAGEWTGSIAVGPDERLYVSIGASCNACAESDPRRAAILSYTLAGEDMQIVASGLHRAFDFAWNPVDDTLWIGESERADRGESEPLDELNYLTTPGAHFGWPDCYQTANGTVPDDHLDHRENIDCAAFMPPALTFDAGSRPAGMLFYNGDAFPEMRGDLLVVTSGSWNRRLPSGYAVYRVCFDEEGALEPCTDAAGDPVSEPGSPYLERIAPVESYYGYGLAVIQVQGNGFYPDHPVDITTDPAGSILISLMEGRILRLRPR